MMDRSVLFVSLVVIFTGAGILPANPQPQPARPNFLVILTDDQSWVGTSYLADPADSRTRSDYYQTPHMGRLAQMGMRFTNGYAPAPFCCPTRKSITIGQTPAKHEYQRDRANWTSVFRKQLSIPQMLKQADPRYRTAHFGKWDARYDEVTPEEMGYDVSDGLTGNNTGGGKSNIKWPVALDDPKLIFNLTERAGQFMERQARDGHPFYVQVSHYAVHLGITYRQDTLAKYQQADPGKKHRIPEFAAMTEDLDAGIGILLNRMNAAGLLKNTYIIFLSDNGGRNSQPLRGDHEAPRNDPLRDGKGSMYEGGIRVPFVVAGPGVAKNSVSHVPVTGLDILPTLADLAGYPEKLPELLDGGSIRQVLLNGGKGTVKRQRPYLIFHHAVDRKAQSAIRAGNFKLVKTWKGNQLELFDLSQDLSESNDLSEEMPTKTEELHTRLVAFLTDVDAETRQTRKKKP